jgi:hypothetical protein
MTLIGDPVIIVVSREEVEAVETSSAMTVLRSCLESTERALSFFERLDVAFHGYNDDSRELCEIQAVRDYVHALDHQFPYWLFFLTKEGLGLQCIMYCLMPPYLSEDGRRTILPRRLDELLSKRWFPAMNQLCLAVGFSERQIEDLTNRTIDYFVNGPCDSLASLDRSSSEERALSPIRAAKGFKPDYGLHLMQQGISSSVDLFFYDFPLYSLSILGRGEYSTMVEKGHGGEFYALSLDFDHAQLEQILAKANPRLAAFIRTNISHDPASPRSIDFNGHVVFSVRARLGHLQTVAKEQFVPLVAQEIF